MLLIYALFIDINCSSELKSVIYLFISKEKCLLLVSVDTDYSRLITQLLTTALLCVIFRYNFNHFPQRERIASMVNLKVLSFIAEYVMLDYNKTYFHI